ncbi:Acetate--CoA ligase [ADP-forming] I [uncultured archaeon]|nr:Acetate--CoA ligase [ADP-forming] I [uncultured archaeon]
MRNAGKARVQGMLVQKMVKQGIELIIGGRRDPQFGPIVMFGLGGIFVEILRDVSIRVCPVTRAEADEMIDEIKGSPLLHGARGTVPVDTGKLARMLVNVSKMLYENREICEFDLNPVIADAKGVLAVDVRVVSCKA